MTLEKIQAGEIELYFDRASGRAGIHVAGIARLSSIAERTVLDACTRLNLGETVSIPTPAGLRSARVLWENEVVALLTSFVLNAKSTKENQSKASSLLTKFAEAGCKLMIMLEVAPEEVAKSAIARVDESNLLETWV